MRLLILAWANGDVVAVGLVAPRGPDTGPEARMVPSEGQVVVELEAPAGLDADADLTTLIEDYRLDVHRDPPAVVRRARSPSGSPLATSPVDTVDLSFEIRWGQSRPDGWQKELTLEPTGRCRFVVQRNRSTLDREALSYYLSEQALAYLKRAVEDSEVLGARSRYNDLVDGDWVSLTVTLGGESNTCVLRNSRSPAVDSFVSSLNEMLPDDLQVSYSTLGRGDLPGMVR
jgi:hypothetical protein